MLRKLFNYFTPLMLGTCDVLASSGIMYYSARYFLKQESTSSEEADIVLSSIISASTGVILSLTRFPALWRVFNNNEYLAENTEYDEESALLDNPELKLANIELENSLMSEFEEAKEVSFYNRTNRLNYEKSRFSRCPVASAYLAAFWLGSGLSIVQYLGTKTTLENLQFSEGVSLRILSILGGIGSVTSYFVFVIYGGALNNAKLLVNECFSRKENNQTQAHLSSQLKHMIFTGVISFFGAFSNSTFDFFSSVKGFKAFPYLSKLPNPYPQVFGGINAISLFYIIFLSYVLDVHKLFGNFRFRNELGEIRNLSTLQKLFAASTSVVFIINKASIFYIFYSSGKETMIGDMKMSKTSSIILSSLSALSATFIQGVFEFKPTLKNSLCKPASLCNMSCFFSHKKRSMPELDSSNSEGEMTKPKRAIKYFI